MKKIIQNVGGSLTVFMACVALVNWLAWKSPVLNNEGAINTTDAHGLFPNSSGTTTGPALWKSNSIIIFGTYKNSTPGYTASINRLLNFVN